MITVRQIQNRTIAMSGAASHGRDFPGGRSDDIALAGQIFICDYFYSTLLYYIVQLWIRQPGQFRFALRVNAISFRKSVLGISRMAGELEGFWREIFQRGFPSFAKQGEIPALLRKK